MRGFDGFSFPEHLLDVPGFVGEVVRHNLSIAPKPQPVLALAGAIALQAVLAGRKVADDGGNRTNLYILGIARTGFGKDAGRLLNKAILFEAGAANLEGPDKVTSESAIVTALETRPALLFQWDELGDMLTGAANPERNPLAYSIASCMLRLFSSAGQTYQACGYADAKRNKTLAQPCCVVVGTTGPDKLSKAITADSISDGLLGRMLIFEANADPDQRRTRTRPIPPSIVERARWWNEYEPPGGNIQRQHPNPRVVETDRETDRLRDECIRAFERMRREGDDANAALWVRGYEKACRLALVYACSRNPENPVIDSEALTWAYDLVVFLTQRMIRWCDRYIADGPFETKLKKLARIIEEHGEMTQTDLARKTGWLTSKERKELLLRLDENEQIQTRLVEGKTKPTTLVSVRRR